MSIVTASADAVDILRDRITVMLPTMDVAVVNAVQSEIPAYRNRARLPVWCGAYLLGSVFTLLWFLVLTGILSSARPVDPAVTPQLELVMPPQADAPAPTVVPPVKPKLQPPPLVAPTTNDSSPIPPMPADPPPAISNADATPGTAIEAPIAATPTKIEPLFRLTRLPDFGNATTLRYPAAEKNRGREGKVIAEFVIDEHGAVRDIKILKGAGALFDQAVIDELSNITFTPPYIGARAVAARFRREFQFKLD